MNFTLSAKSEYGRYDADVDIALLSIRPEKALAELLVLELSIQESIGKLRAHLQQRLPAS